MCTFYTTTEGKKTQTLAMTSPDQASAVLQKKGEMEGWKERAGDRPWLLTGILASPLPSVCLVAGSVCLVGVCDLGNERIVGVGVSQHGADRQQDLGDCESWRPLIPQDIQADAAVAVDVGVVDSGCEVDL